jgi:small subunit ribosomal protein S6
MYIISPLRVSEEEIGATMNRVAQAITSLSGEVTATNHAAPWGRRKFAYPIREYAEGEASRRVFTEGYYVLLHFSLPTDRIPELERRLKLTDAVLRYLLTVVDVRSLVPAAPIGAPAVAEVADDGGEDEGEDEDEE